MRKIIAIIIIALILGVTTAVVIATNMKQASIGETKATFIPIK
ncbi:MAG: hypothetical protein ACUVWP_00965 [bacterium]